ncbi:MAG: DUF2232 domain-containing protein [Hyphomicrobium sp.]
MSITYRLLIALGAGTIAAVVFASATTGPVLMRMVLFMLTPLALFLAGVGLGPLAAVVAGVAGTLLVLAAGTATASMLFAASQAIPVAILVYLAALHRETTEGTKEWYPPGRLVVAAAVLAGAFATFTLFLLGWDVEALRSVLRSMLQAFAETELPNMPDAPALGPNEINELADIALKLLPAASAVSSMCSLLFNLWLAGRITLASGRLERPWPDLPAMTYPPITPLLLALSTGLGFFAGMAGMVAAAFAGALFFAYVLLGLAVVHYVTRGRSWRLFALWALYAALFVISTIALLPIALIGLAEAIWPMRKPMNPPRPPPGGPQT